MHKPAFTDVLVVNSCWHKSACSVLLNQVLDDCGQRLADRIGRLFVIISINTFLAKAQRLKEPSLLFGGCI